MRHQIIFGTSVINNEPPTVKNPTVFFPGRAMTGQLGFQINDNIMSKHILLLGGSGCGKTNSFFYTVKALRESMNGEDIAIIFDTKGEFYDEFSRAGDYVIGNSARFRSRSLAVRCGENLPKRFGIVIVRKSRSHR